MPESKCYSEIQVRKLAEEGYDWAIRGRNQGRFPTRKKKATAEWLFFDDGQSLASQGPPIRTGLREVELSGCGWSW